MDNLKTLLTSLLVANANKKWILPNPITVRLSDQDFDVLEIQGLQVSEKMDLYVMVFSDGHGYDVEQWSRLGELCEPELIDKVVDRIYEVVLSVYNYRSKTA
jgi:hypothetical protein